MMGEALTTDHHLEMAPHIQLIVSVRVVMAEIAKEVVVHHLVRNEVEVAVAGEETALKATTIPVVVTKEHLPTIMMDNCRHQKEEDFEVAVHLHVNIVTTVMDHHHLCHTEAHTGDKLIIFSYTKL